MYLRLLRSVPKGSMYCAFKDSGFQQPYQVGFWEPESLNRQYVDFLGLTQVPQGSYQELPKAPKQLLAIGLSCSC